jgi:endonuclease/exonuclease/phosphatase family metal-dependent hydrolase
VKLTAISWNLFHGRDFPPDPGLLTWRSRMLRRTERNATHVQLNRDLLPEFAALLAGAEWDVALLQECPPRFAEPLARACDAEAHCVLTSRNSLSALRQLAARLNPDLIASGEGGSNLTLVRGSLRCAFWSPERHKAHREEMAGGGAEAEAGGILERRALAIHTGPLERRAMAFTRTASGLCVANLHASAHRPELAAADVLRAATAASEWSAGAPLLFGGDFNLQPDESPAVFAELRERFGLAPPTAPNAIDHLLARDLEIVERPRRWAAERREVRHDGLALRLSDHAPVEARFATSNGWE